MRRGAGPCIGGQKNLRPLGLVRHRPGSAEKCPVRPGQVWYTKVTPAIKWQIQQGAREIRPLRDVRRRAAGRHQGDRTLVYLYDFGDGWEHTIKIERLAVPEPGEFYPRLVEVAGRCPPEDCGGPWGYAELLAAIKDPRHERHTEFTEWIGDYFDPNADDAEELTAEVGTLARSWAESPSANVPDAADPRPSPEDFGVPVCLFRDDASPTSGICCVASTTTHGSGVIEKNTVDVEFSVSAERAAHQGQAKTLAHGAPL
jgi:hypothetical protein